MKKTISTPAHLIEKKSESEHALQRPYSSFLDAIPLELDSSLNGLALEAEGLFKLFDAISTNITKCEDILHKFKIYIPHRILIHKENRSNLMRPEDRHLVHPHMGGGINDGYVTEIDWYLSWEYEENSKRYRLCLILEEKEIIVYQIYSDDDIERLGYKEFQSTPIFKKALIETDLQKRLKSAACLDTFINSFKRHLSDYRENILFQLDFKI